MWTPGGIQKGGARSSKKSRERSSLRGRQGAGGEAEPRFSVSLTNSREGMQFQADSVREIPKGLGEKIRRLPG